MISKKLDFKTRLESFENFGDTIIKELNMVISDTNKGVIEILINGKKIEEDALKRGLKKLAEIVTTQGVLPDTIITLVKLVNNKEKLIDIIDSNDTKKLSSLLIFCEVEKLANYINSNKRSLIIDTIQQKSRDKIEKLSKKINKIKLPKISGERIFPDFGYKN
ncbi:hypothetical protein EOM39_05765 [Candidatus Gracilibacteria bacterium]|nr:hypothetical protein [Candidatus Gracilibacteria bacterium]